MSIYKQTDVDLLKDNWDNIIDAITRKKMEIFEPTGKEKDSVMLLLLNFIKEKKRKIYGGYALNALVELKDKKDAIYKDIDSPDIDFYSPEPIKDLIELCNILHDKGFKYINGKEAMHKETYSIYVNYVLYCDISYVPKNIYNKMPFKEIDGINYIHPSFMSIDYLRMLTDPLVSYWRIDKGFKRFCLLQKHYPLVHNVGPIEIENSNEKIDYALNTIYDFLINKKTCINVGLYAYNYFLHESGILQSKKPDKKFSYLDTPYYEFISSNYRDDARELLSILKVKFPSGSIRHEESYPFFQFVGYSVTIYHEDDVIAIIYHNNNKCLPFMNVKALKFTKSGAIEDKNESNKITLGTFALTILFALIASTKARTNDDEDTKNLSNAIISHVTEMRKYYFEKNNKNMFDNTIFKDFVIECIGDTIMPDREKRLLIEQRKKSGKRYMFMYDPSTDKREGEINVNFSNSSGNPIRKEKNLKLADVKHEILIEEEDTE